MHQFRSEFHQVFRNRRIVEVDLGSKVPHAGVVSQLEDFLFAYHSRLQLFLDVGAYMHPVTGIGQGGVGEEFAREDMVPAQPGQGVAPVNVEIGIAAAFHVDPIQFNIDVAVFVAVVEDVPSVVETGVEPVPVGNTPVELGVGVVEVIVYGSVEHLVDERGEEETVKHSSAHAERQLVLYDGPFQMNLVRERPDPHSTVELLHVAVVGADVDYRRDAPSVPGRERALVERDLLYRLRLEDAQDSEQMVGVVKGDAVEQEQVLLGAAATHVDAAEAFGAALHAGHELDRLEHVVLPEQHRRLLDYGHGQFDGAHFGASYSRILRCRHGGAFQPVVRHEVDVQGGIFLKVEIYLHLRVAHVRADKGMAPLRQGKGIEAV